jgi:hypothetical protein
MRWIVSNIDWILIVSGAATCSMLLQALAPRLAWRTVFGEEAKGLLAEFMARSWGVMIFAAGLLMIYAAWHSETRFPILLYAIVASLTSPFSLRRAAALPPSRFVLAWADLVIIGC